MPSSYFVLQQLSIRGCRPSCKKKDDNPIIEAGILLLLCQLTGESIVRALEMPVPEPVPGTVLMLAFLALRRKVPDSLDKTSHDLLANFSLLFVPAGAGIILHVQRLEAQASA